MGEFSNARPDLKLSDYAVRRIRAAWVDGTPISIIVRTYRTSDARVKLICADLPPREPQVRLKRQAPNIPRDVG